MPNIANPHKQFQWSIQLSVLDPFLAQKCDLPSPEIDVAEHGDRNFIVKTGGIIKYDMLTIEKISRASIDSSNNWIWDWVQRIQDPFAFGGDIPEDYKVNAEVIKFATDGFTIIGRWEMEGLWPSKINNVELNRVESNNTIESIEFQLDKMRKTM